MRDIIVDWGSTNFRAFLVDGAQVLDRCGAAGKGVLQLPTPRDQQDRIALFSGILKDALAPWLAAQNGLPEIFMCGAIGSQEGWVNTGYNEAPMTLLSMAQSLRPLSAEACGAMGDNARIHILPGLAIYQKGRHDMMRSEEIKSLGALAGLGLNDGVLCIPGTHCKWVKITGGEIVAFRSVLTGEFYNTLQKTGALAPLFPAAPSPFNLEAFQQGLHFADEGQDLLHDVWQVRSHKIRGAYPAGNLQSLLSGILIGHEMRAVRDFVADGTPVILLSDGGERRDCYHHAITHAGWAISHSVASEEAVCTGMMRLIAAYKQP